MRLSNSQARHLILDLQGLCAQPGLKMDRRELRTLIHKLGYVQVDSIQWVERAHHMILYARNQTYRPKHLKPLLESEKVLFENWTHDASIIPTEFYRYWRHKFDRDRPRLKQKFTDWQGSGFLGKCDALVEKIVAEGPKRSRDLDRPKSTKKLEMWQWHDGKAALEYLWRTGELGVCGRDGFQKIYDTTANSVNPDCYGKRVGRDEFKDWACRSAIERLGFGSAGDIARFWDLLSIDEVKEWLAGPGAGSFVEVDVETTKRGEYRPVLACADIESKIDQLQELPKRVRTLSPFDPVIRNRNRLEWLFGFDYRIEIYVPEAKRKYGYYVFPLLEKDKLIGRVDMRADRKADVLEIKRLWLEPKVRLSAGRQNAVHGEFVRQCRLANVSDVRYLDGWLYA